jgi:hypothetical protein
MSVIIAYIERPPGVNSFSLAVEQILPRTGSFWQYSTGDDILQQTLNVFFPEY